MIDPNTPTGAQIRDRLAAETGYAPSEVADVLACGFTEDETRKILRAATEIHARPLRLVRAADELNAALAAAAEEDPHTDADPLTQRDQRYSLTATALCSIAAVAFVVAATGSPWVVTVAVIMLGLVGFVAAYLAGEEHARIEVGQ